MKSSIPYKPRAIIFDLGGTLVDWPDQDVHLRWSLAYDYLMQSIPRSNWPTKDAFVTAMCAAEEAHWEQVATTQWSGPPSGLLRNGFRLLEQQLDEVALLALLDCYARAASGRTIIYPDTCATLQTLRSEGYKLALLSNTWWAADWHNADLAAHGLVDLLDEVVYTSDLPHSKPHPSVFYEVTNRLSIEPGECVMVGDRCVDDIAGGLDAGMRAVWMRNDKPWNHNTNITPSASISRLSELHDLLHNWVDV